MRVCTRITNKFSMSIARMYISWRTGELHIPNACKLSQLFIEYTGIMQRKETYVAETSL